MTICYPHSYEGETACPDCSVSVEAYVADTVLKMDKSCKKKLAKLRQQNDELRDALIDVVFSAQEALAKCEEEKK